MKEVLSFLTFGIGALCFVAFFTTLKPLAVTATTGLANSAYCSTKASPAKIVHLDRGARHLAQAR
jgi:hypothetical protein